MTLRHVVDSFAGNAYLFDFAGKRCIQLQHSIKQQILIAAVFLDIVNKQALLFIHVFLRREVHIFHVAAVAFQNTETDVQILCCQ